MDSDRKMLVGTRNSATRLAQPVSGRISPPNFGVWEQALQSVKNLYLKGQWRQCTAYCEELLSGDLVGSNSKPHPIHTSTLHFYHATSFSEILRHTRDAEQKAIIISKMRASYSAALKHLPTQPVESFKDSEKRRNLDNSVADMRELILEKIKAVDEMRETGSAGTEREKGRYRRWIKREMPSRKLNPRVEIDP